MLTAGSISASCRGKLTTAVGTLRRKSIITGETSLDYPIIHPVIFLIKACKLPEITASEGFNTSTSLSTLCGHYLHTEILFGCLSVLTPPLQTPPKRTKHNKTKQNKLSVSSAGIARLQDCVRLQTNPIQIRFLPKSNDMYSVQTDQSDRLL